jgi:hypothetical protein
MKRYTVLAIGFFLFTSIGFVSCQSTEVPATETIIVPTTSVALDAVDEEVTAVPSPTATEIPLDDAEVEDAAEDPEPTTAPPALDPEPAEEDVENDSFFSYEEIHEMVAERRVEIEPVMLPEPDVRSVTIEVERVAMPDGALTKPAEDGWQTDIQYPLHVFLDGAENIWFSAVDGVFQLDALGNQRIYEQFDTQDLPDLAVIAATEEQELFGAGCTAVYRFNGEDWDVVLEGPLLAAEQEAYANIFMYWCVSKMAFAADGSLWATQMDIPQDHDHGILQIVDNDFTWFDTPYITAILPQANGDVWFGTAEGLLMLQDGNWHRLPESVHTQSSWITTGMIGPDGAAWLGTPVEFARFDGQVWTNYQLSDGAPLDLFAFTYDASGDIWLSTLDGIGHFDGERLLLYTYDEADNPFYSLSNPMFLGVSMLGLADSMVMGPDGALWLTFGPAGILRFEVPVN